MSTESFCGWKTVWTLADRFCQCPDTLRLCCCLSSLTCSLFPMAWLSLCGSRPQAHRLILAQSRGVVDWSLYPSLTGQRDAKIRTELDYSMPSKDCPLLPLPTGDCRSGSWVRPLCWECCSYFLRSLCQNPPACGGFRAPEYSLWLLFREFRVLMRPRFCFFDLIYSLLPLALPILSSPT